MDFVRFAIIGLGTGGLIALAAQGLIVTYRASGVVNFAQGAIGMAGAFAFYDLRDKYGLPWQVAILLGILAGGVLGAASHILIMRPLRRASPLVRLIATLGLLTIIQNAFTLRYGTDQQLVHGILPTYLLTPVHKMTVSMDRVILLGVALVLTAVLSVIYQRTRFGVTTSAVAESEQAAAARAVSPATIAAVNWGVGGGLAAGVAILIAPIVGLEPTQLTFLVLPALAAALVGGFSSFGLALAGGLTIGVVGSELARYTTVPGLSDSVPFVMIIAVLLVRSRALPTRGELMARLPSLGPGRAHPLVVIGWLVAAIAAILLLPTSWVDPMTTSMLFAFITLSLVVVTGLAGQLSLAQFGLAGVGAWTAGRLIANYHIPFEVALVAGVGAGAAVGVIVGLPALRARGVTLAVATLGLGLVLDVMLLSSQARTGGLNGTVIGTPHLFGLNIDSNVHPQRYAFVVFTLLVLCAFAVCNVRRGRSGRRLIAVRSNERAAAALGVNRHGAKLYAFALSAAIAALGGVLTSFRFSNVLFAGTYSVMNSISAVLVGVIGGIGWVSGALLGAAVFIPDGLAARPLSTYTNLTETLRTIAGFFVLATLIFNQNGMAETHNVQAILRRFHRGKPKPLPSVPSRPKSVVEAVVRPATLEIRNLTVRFSGVVAVDGVSLSVAPGEVVGLIGPNGAGKTTLIDGVTGFVPLATGEITVDGRRIEGWSVAKRARAGLGRSFQSLELFDDMTVLDNLRTASDRHDVRSYVFDLIRPAEVPLSDGAWSAVTELGLVEDLNARTEDLSYGRRRLVAIARTLATGPAVLLLDEPCAGLDDEESEHLGDLIRRLAREWGIGVLLVEHNVDLVMKVCDRICVLDRGTVIAQGTPSVVQAHEAVIAAYLGEDEDTATGVDDPRLASADQSGVAFERSARS